MKRQSKTRDKFKFVLKNLSEWSERQEVGLVAELLLELTNTIKEFEQNNDDVFGTWGSARTIFGDD